MSKKITNHGMMIIVTVLLVVLVFSGMVYATPVLVTNPEVEICSDIGTIHKEDLLVSNAYLIYTPADWQNIVSNSEYWDKTLILANDIVFTSPVDSIGNSSCKFSGTIYGNSSKFINFTQSGTNAYGLINYAGDGCILNYVQMVDSNIVSGNSNVGGLVGTIDYANTNGVRFCGCSVVLSTVSSNNGNVGGLVGVVNSEKFWINSSCVDRSYVSGRNTAGGLIGVVNSASTVRIQDSCVNSSEIVSGTYSAGGLVGSVHSTNILMNTTVHGCKILVGSNSAGGLIGRADSKNMIENCLVENCTISSDGNFVGGLIGRTNSVETVALDSQTSRVKWTWIEGKSDIGSIVGDKVQTAITTDQHTMVYGSSGVQGSGWNQFDIVTDFTTAKNAGSVSPIDYYELKVGIDYGYRECLFLENEMTTTTRSGNSPQKSPAPFLGIIAGLGVVAVLLRNRE